MGSFAHLLSRLDADPRLRGREFEHICAWYLANEPLYRSELTEVWLWDGWPGRWGADAGIDLVAEDHATAGSGRSRPRPTTPALLESPRLDVDTFLTECRPGPSSPTGC